MSNRSMHIAVGDTAPSMTVEQFLMRRVMSTHLLNQRLFSNPAAKKTPADMPNIIRPQPMPSDALRLRSKVKDLCYNCDGSRLYVASRDTLTVLETEGLTAHCTHYARCTRVLVHPKDPEIFALLLMEGGEIPRACVKIFSLPENPGAEPKLKCTIWSGFDQPWYAGAWSLDGNTIALIDRGDRLQCVDVSTFADCELPPSSAISLATEVYGVLYTSDALVLQKVDGRIDILSSDLTVRASEQAHSHIVMASAYNSTLDLMATGGSDHTVQVFSCADDYTCIGTFPGLEGKVSSLSFSQDGVLLAWGTKDTLYVSGDNSSLSDTAPTGDEYYLTVAGTDPCEVYVQVRMPVAVTHVQFSPCGYFIAYACDFDTMPKQTGSTGAVGILPAFRNDSCVRGPDDVLTVSPEVDARAESSALSNVISSAPRPLSVVVLSDSPGELEKLRSDVESVLRLTRERQVDARDLGVTPPEISVKPPKSSPQPDTTSRLHIISVHYQRYTSNIPTLLMYLLAVPHACKL
ncbi:WD G-beta repeat protein [Babesia ovata]|uniref:WD G-beta repeat protein n=1 Tax=Babesia ovata TaxID=189622 RepID=A0A2H6K748_9APIC|nr:WD G-beta repeat protein [Babesia ovata]GBE58802.1 WD G-beta repeat protein [Babesia ovata]